MRRLLKILGWTLAVLIGVPLVLIVALLIFANTGPGRHELERLTASLTGGMVRIQGLSGRFPDALRISRIEVADAKGVYVTVDNAVLDWSPTQLIHREVDIDRLDAGKVSLARLPVSSAPSKRSSGSYNLPVRVVLKQLHVDDLAVAAPVAGHAVSLAVAGNGTLDSMTTGSLHVSARQLDGGGTYAVSADVTPAAIHATAQINEPPHGLIAGIAHLTQVGAIAVNAKVDGPRDALATHLSVTAEPLTAAAEGTIDLTREAAHLTVTANAPAMTPEPGVSWQSVHIDAKVDGPFKQPSATGTVRIADLRAAGASIGALNADLSGNAGALQLHAQLDDLHVPGPKPDLLAAAPLLVDATVRMDAPNRPATLVLHHPLLTVDASAQTEGALRAQAHVILPDLAPFAAAAGTSLQGHANLTLRAAQTPDGGTDSTDSLAVQGSVGLTGGTAPAPALLGDDARIDLAAEMKGKDLTLSHLAVDGKALNVTANGVLASGRINLDWAVRLTDLAAVRPDLAGQIAAHGTVSGPTHDLALNADLSGDLSGKGFNSGTLTAHVEAQGLPDNPSGRLTARGSLLDAPLDVALAASRTNGVLQVTIDKADWKSLHAEGAISLTPPAAVPTGKLTLTMTHLADLSPLLGEPIAGSVTAALTADQQAARIDVTVQGAALPGTASIAKATVNATVSGPEDQAPVIDGTVTLDGVSVHGATIGGKLIARGPTNALDVRVTAAAANLMGSSAQLQTAGTVDANAKTLDLTQLRADWKQQALRLLAPVRIGFSDGVSLGQLRLALGQATIDVSGHTGPTLELNASLRNLPVDIAAAVDPTLAADGTLNAQAHLTGTTARPTGTIRVTATGVRLRQGPGRGLPAADLTAAATLTGTAADLDTRLQAGRSRLTLTGSAPLTKAGRLDLHTSGTIDLVMLDPILASEGRRVRGEVTLNAGIGGTLTAPQVNGTARLAQGDVQDIALGAHLTDMTATIQATGDTIRLTQFTGRAGNGTVAADGTVGLAGDKPIDLRLTANNASPISSTLLTEVIDANMTVQGALEGNLTVGGVLDVRRANIQVPEKLPASVAVLPVRVAGAPPPPPSTTPAKPPLNIGLDLTLNAPQQIFIRGRGLNVELGGVIHIRGTASNPQPDGGLHLRQGTFSLVGHTLTFTEGSFTFTGAGITDPSLHLVAQSTTPTMVATLTVSGSAKDPKITLSSVPQAPQDEILAQLLFQSTTAKLSPFQIAEVASALASLTGAPSSIADPLGSLRSALGLDQLSVGTSTTGSPTLQAGTYVARGVYLGAQQSATGSGTQATVQVDLAKGLRLETTAGTGPTSATGATSSQDQASVGLTYRFQY